jgi:hypothetical protein
MLVCLGICAECISFYALSYTVFLLWYSHVWHLLPFRKQSPSLDVSEKHLLISLTKSHTIKSPLGPLNPDNFHRHRLILWVHRNNYNLTVAWWRMQYRLPKRHVYQERLILCAASKLIFLIMDQQSPRIFRKSCEFPPLLRGFCRKVFSKTVFVSVCR